VEQFQQCEKYQGLLKLIGYIPFDFDISTLAGRIIFYRYIKGLTAKEFGTLMLVDASTVRD